MIPMKLHLQLLSCVPIELASGFYFAAFHLQSYKQYVNLYNVQGNIEIDKWFVE
jgi:hypothetical protein